jgi:hypothetical protein
MPPCTYFLVQNSKLDVNFLSSIYSNYGLGYSFVVSKPWGLDWSQISTDISPANVQVKLARKTQCKWRYFVLDPVVVDGVFRQGPLVVMK